MKTHLLPFIFFALCLGCKNTSEEKNFEDIDDNIEISESNIIKLNKELNNSMDIKIIESDLRNITDSISYSASMPNNDNSLEWAKIKSFENNEIKPKKVNLETVIKDVFDPEKSPCSLPTKVKRKLLKLKEKGEGWAPKVVVNYTKKLPVEALELPTSSLTVLLHTISIASTNNVEKSYILFGSPTFKNLDINILLVNNGFDSFMYSLDCSGYLNAAIEGSGIIPGADIKASAEAALSSNNSMLIGGGVIISPLAAAYYGNALGINFDKKIRIEILKSLTDIPDTKNSDKIIIKPLLEVIWVSNTGNSSFNGEANFNSNASLGFGPASVGASNNTGATLTRESSYTSFRTFYTNRKIISTLEPFTVADVKTLINSLEGE